MMDGLDTPPSSCHMTHSLGSNPFHTTKSCNFSIPNASSDYGLDHFKLAIRWGWIIAMAISNHSKVVYYFYRLNDDKDGNVDRHDDGHVGDSAGVSLQVCW